MPSRSTLPLALAAALLASGAAAAQPGAKRAEPPADYSAQVKALFRTAACRGDAPLPAAATEKMLARHCRGLESEIAWYRKAWLNRATPFLARLRPADLPRTVVYPFGGADLMTALATFPDALEITAISLEPMGDPRAHERLTEKQLRANLDLHLQKVHRLFREAHSTTNSLSALADGELPGELLMDLTALAVHGFEPLSLRYFRLAPDGKIVYLGEAEIDRAVAEAAAAGPAPAPPRNRAKGVKPKRASPNDVPAFASAEITYRKAGETEVRVFRHIAFNLDDQHLSADPSLIEHLESKGRIAVMIKAASFLLWNEPFTRMREYLLAAADWMISDSSGIPPEYSLPAGFELTTYGVFEGTYFRENAVPKHAKAFVKLWEKQPRRELPFRWGYPDIRRNGHLLITRRTRKS